MQPSSAAPRTDIRPLPAPEYPYPRGAAETDHRPARDTQRKSVAPSEAEGRVAQAQHWGYKPIRWQSEESEGELSMRPAHDLQPADSSDEVRPVANFVPAPQPQDRPAGRVLESPRLTAPQAVDAHASSPQTGSAPQTEPARPYVAPAVSAPKRVYDNSGWSSAPR